jgi:hypothetical protein
VDNEPTPDEIYRGRKQSPSDEAFGFEIEENFQHFNGRARAEKENADAETLETCIVVGTEMPGKVIEAMPSALVGTAAGVA